MIAKELFLPVVIPLVTALIGLIWLKPGFSRRILYAVSGFLQLVIALWLVDKTKGGELLILPLGNWGAPFGIMLTVDLLGAIMLVLSSLTALAAILYGFAETPIRVGHPMRLPLMQFLVMGINLSFCTGDLFNLFVGFEIMLISSYALLTLEADDWDIKHAFPYLVINIFGSAIFLVGVGLCYGLTGTLNFADLCRIFGEMGPDPRIDIFAAVLVFVFAVKAGLFPLYFWLPHSYPTLPTSVAALYSGMLTKVGVYVLIRMLGTVLPHNLHYIYTALIWLAVATMIFGVLGALSRGFIRGILSYHILSQIGFMVLAIGFFTPLSVAAAIFYIMHHIIVKSTLFLIGGTAALLNKSDDLDFMGNLWKQAPFLGVLFLCQALSLAGIPPLSGFWGKYMIIVVGIEQGQWIPVAASVLASILTLVSMLKIWNGAFWKESTDVPVRSSDRRWVKMTAVIAVMTAISLVIGLGAEYFIGLAETAANTALDQQGYIQKVLTVQGKEGAL
ncbi:MAG: proton-conducting transporter membrane subunit [Verrucomicrobiota bacterium]|nr:proton-conducting transporter membrane subunit [Verrucomicrobiota bacterium]